MRMDGALKLILNSKIFPTMPARLVGENSVALSALSDEGDGKPEMKSFLLKLQGRPEAELLLAAIEERKVKAALATESRGMKRSTSTKEQEQTEQRSDASAKEEQSGKGKREKPDAPKKIRRRSGDLSSIESAATTVAKKAEKEHSEEGKDSSEADETNKKE